jgi:hypothetical protein
VLARALPGGGAHNGVWPAVTCRRAEKKKRLRNMCVGRCRVSRACEHPTFPVLCVGAALHIGGIVGLVVCGCGFGD